MHNHVTTNYSSLDSNDYGIITFLRVMSAKFFSLLLIREQLQQTNHKQFKL